MKSSILRSIALSFTVALSSNALAQSVPSPGQMRSIESKMIQSNASELPTVWGLRFIDFEHWQNVLRYGNINGIGYPSDSYLMAHPYLAYGDAPFKSWSAAQSYLLPRSATRPPTMDDLKGLHTIAYDYPHSQDAFYKYQIDNSTYSRADKQTLHQHLQNGNYRYLHTLGFVSILGRLRSEPGIHLPGDPTWSSGSTNGGNPYLETDDSGLQVIRIKPHITVVKAVRLPNGRIGVWIKHPAGREVGMRMFDWNLIRMRAERMKQNEAPGSMKLRLAAAGLFADAQILLNGVHIFYDGCGRVTKLALQWLSNYLEVPIPAQFPLKDFEMTSYDLGRFYLQQMEKTESLFRGLSQRYPPAGPFGPGGSCSGSFGAP